MNKRLPWLKTINYIKTRCGDKTGRYYKKGIKNLITSEELKYLWFRDKGWLLERPSIDRIDSKKNYTIDNCRYIELSENTKNTQISSQTARLFGSIKSKRKAITSRLNGRKGGRPKKMEHIFRHKENLKTQGGQG